MQSINYSLSLVLAWLLLSERRIPIGVRVLLVFSVTVLIYMGDVARSYTLAAVLLVAAARCLLSRRRHWLAMALLCLAVNTHFLAIPVVASIFIFLYWLRPETPAISVKAAAFSRFQQRQFWISTAMLGVALALCYATLRPAPDISVPHYTFSKATRLDYLISGIGSVWRYFSPNVPESATAFHFRSVGVGTGATPLDTAITLALWLLALALLPTRRSRSFMIAVSLLWTLAVWNTVHLPSQFHATFLFVGYAIALMISEPEGRDRPWLPVHYAEPLLLVLLGLQVSTSIVDSAYELRYDFSGAKATAEFLLHSGLTQRPLVVEPDAAAPALLAYTGVPSAYYPDCQCRGPFVVFRRGRVFGRQITAPELEAQRRQFHAEPILIANPELTEADRKKLGLHLIYQSPHGWFWDHEDFSVYDTSAPIGQTAATENGGTTEAQRRPSATVHAVEKSL